MRILTETLRIWRETPFPPGSAIDALDEAHADLALCDSWVAESVLPYVQTKLWEPAVPDVISALDSLVEDVEELLAGGTSDAEAASLYVAYAEALRSVYVAFLQEGAVDDPSVGTAARNR